jgi:uncharacterized membrane protein YdjX (TVP38/TMEM64 family)
MIDIIFSLLISVDNYIKENYIFSVIVVCIFLIFYSALSLPGSIVFFVSSGFFFGVFLGFIINIFSIVIGSLIFFLLSKLILKKIFNKIYNKYSKKLTKLIKSSSFEYLILLRLIIGTPLFVQNICLSILDINKKKFLISSTIGFTPLMFFFSYIGNNLYELVEVKLIKIQDILNTNFIILVIILLFFLTIRIMFNKNQNE